MLVALSLCLLFFAITKTTTHSFSFPTILSHRNNNIPNQKEKLSSFLTDNYTSDHTVFLYANNGYVADCLDDDENDDDDLSFDECIGMDEVDLECFTSPLSSLSLPKGSMKDYRIIRQYKVPEFGFDLRLAAQTFPDIHRVLQRVDMTELNVTLPVALMLSDSKQFPTLTKARKAIRKGSIIVQTCVDANEIDIEKVKRGKVDIRVQPNDLIARQVLMPDGVYSGMVYAKPGFDLPVIYEDNHVAIVNKPAGIPIFANRQVGHRRMTIEAALPFALQPPDANVNEQLKFPQPAHRLDKPTSGLLLVAKTKQAIVSLSTQFENRIIQKSYSAIINGIPTIDNNRTITGQKALDMGVLISEDNELTSSWQLIDYDLEGKSAITLWRATQFSKSLKAMNQTLTSVDLKLKTGRKHQLRRHLAWVENRPIVGDKTYDNETVTSISLRGNGLFLCSNRVKFQHPYYNTEEGRLEFQQKFNCTNTNDFCNIFLDNDDIVYVSASITVPDKFSAFLNREDDRFNKLNSSL